MAEVVEITNKRQWHSCLKAAKLKNAELQAGEFPWTVVSAIDGRLDDMAAVVAGGHTPTQRERERGMGLGVIAVRSVYAVAPEYCELLLELTDAFDHWSALPDS